MLYNYYEVCVLKVGADGLNTGLLTQTMFSDLNPDLSKLWPSFSNSVVLHLGERSNFNLVCSVLANYLFCYLDMRMCCVVSCVVGFPWLRNSYTDSNHFFFKKKGKLISHCTVRALSNTHTHTHTHTDILNTKYKIKSLTFLRWYFFGHRSDLEVLTCTVCFVYKAAPEHKHNLVKKLNSFFPSFPEQ